MPGPSMAEIHYAQWKRNGSKSVYAGEIWHAFNPGQDKVFPKNFVSRRANGELATVVNSKEELVENAKLCQVILAWQ